MARDGLWIRGVVCGQGWFVIRGFMKNLYLFSFSHISPVLFCLLLIFGSALWVMSDCVNWGCCFSQERNPLQ